MCPPRVQHFRFLFFLAPHPSSRSAAMGRKASTKDRQTGQTPKGQWVEASRARLQRVEHETEEPTGRSSRARWAQAHWEVATEAELRAAQEPGKIVGHPSRRMMLGEAYRGVLNGVALRLAAFSPTQWTTIVCGRPVQVAPKQEIHLGSMAFVADFWGSPICVLVVAILTLAGASRPACLKRL